MYVLVGCAIFDVMFVQSRHLEARPQNLNHTSMLANIKALPPASALMKSSHLACKPAGSQTKSGLKPCRTQAGSKLTHTLSHERTPRRLPPVRRWPSTLASCSWGRSWLGRTARGRACLAGTKADRQRCDILRC